MNNLKPGTALPGFTCKCRGLAPQRVCGQVPVPAARRLHAQGRVGTVLVTVLDAT